MACTHLQPGLSRVSPFKVVCKIAVGCTHFFEQEEYTYASFIAEVMTEKETVTVCDIIHRQRNEYFTNRPDTPNDT